MGWDFKQIDEAYNRGYNQGYQHGVQDQKQLKQWNLPDSFPNHLESIIVLVRPYDKKTIKYCKKNDVNWIKYNAVYIDGQELYKECNTNEPYSKEAFPNMALFTEKQGVAWDIVELWTSVEIPEWFLNQKKED